MKFLVLLLFLQISFSSNAIIPINVDKYRSFIDSIAIQYQIPADLIIGVGICESGFGISKHAKKLNNYFGIRGKYSRKRKTSYVYFDKPEDSMVEFCELITRKNYYEKLKGNPDAKVWVKALAKAHYAANGRKWSRLVKRAIDSTK
jgi:Bax protein